VLVCLGRLVAARAATGVVCVVLPASSLLTPTSRARLCTRLRIGVPR
jgi:hypothetical protein